MSTQESYEKPGRIPQDSLAAQSETFQAANPDSTPIPQDAASTTLANEDTSAASTIPPAPSASEREEREIAATTASWGTGNQGGEDIAGEAGGLKYPEGAGGQPQFSGTHSQEGYAGGPSQQGQGQGAGSGLASGGGAPSSGVSAEDMPKNTGNTGSGAITSSGTDQRENTSSSSNNDNSNVDPAPTYISSVLSGPGQAGKPKGTNLTEGGFEGEPSSEFPEPGSDQDPSRAALGAQVASRSAAAGNSGGSAGPQDQGTTDQGGFEALGSDVQA